MCVCLLSGSEGLTVDVSIICQGCFNYDINVCYGIWYVAYTNTCSGRMARREVVLDGEAIYVCAV